MRTLSLHPHRDDILAARAAAEAAPLPAAPAPKPLGWGQAMLAFLRTEAPVEPRTLGMRRPSAPAPSAPRPLPGRDCIAYLTAVSAAIHADYERHLDTLRVIDEISAAAPDTHTLTMALAPVVAMLKAVA